MTLLPYFAGLYKVLDFLKPENCEEV